ncbi:MAG: crossover junction endodeoxyribonuclease RuvC [Candidatus Omnitrophota bacterium]
MKILGIDPGLKTTGYGLIDFNGNKLKVLEAGTIETKEKDLIQNRLGIVYKTLNEILAEYKPDVMVLEKLYTHYHHATIACILGHVRGVICLLCAQRDVKLVEHSVKRIRKAVVGSGAASKIQTQNMVAHILNIDTKKLTPDASDALALALGYVQSLRLKI